MSRRRECTLWRAVYLELIPIVVFMFPACKWLHEIGNFEMQRVTERAESWQTKLWGRGIVPLKGKACGSKGELLEFLIENV